MRIMILCGTTMIGFVLGALRNPPALAAGDDLLIGWTVFGAMAGMLLGEMMLRAIGSQRPRRRARAVAAPGPVHEPAPFAARLSQFTHRSPADASAAVDPPRSTMPFWMAAGDGVRTPPRAVWIMRRILRRLQSLWRQAAN